MRTIRTCLVMTCWVVLAVAPVLAQGDPYGMDMPIAPDFSVRPDVTRTGNGSQLRDGPAVSTTATSTVAVDPEAPPPNFFGEEIQTSGSIIYVIDRSSSMWLTMSAYVDSAGNTLMNPNRFEVAKAELKQSISGLSESHTFNIIFYHECISTWRANRVPATAANKQAASDYIDAMTPAGWTNTGVAASEALADAQNDTIILLSDGAPNYLDCSMSLAGTYQDHAAIIQAANVQGAKIHTFGLGLSDAARTFLKQVASDSGGIFVELD